jgi:hypothetical protein
MRNMETTEKSFYKTFSALPDLQIAHGIENIKQIMIISMI